jgi:hypothetical protein
MGPVRAHARQHDPDRTLTLIASQGTEQHVNGQPQAARLRRLGQMEPPADHGELAVRRDHIHHVGLDEH